MKLLQSNPQRRSNKNNSAGLGDPSAKLRAITPGSTIIQVDPAYFRPTEVDQLVGDASKAKEKLEWTPKYDLKMLVQEMVREDFRLLAKS